MLSILWGRPRAKRSPVPSLLLYILHSGNLYGTERMALATLEGLKEYDRRVVVAPLASGRESVATAASSAGFESVSFGSRIGLLLALLPWFLRYRSIDVIGTGVAHSFACHLLSRVFGVTLRQVHVAHGGTVESFDRKHVLNRIPVAQVAVSDFVRHKLVERGVAAERITVIDNFLSDSHRQGGSQRARYDDLAPSRAVDLRRVRVAIVSRVDAIKRIDLLVESGITDDCPEFEFDVYGSGDQFDRLQALCSSQPNLRLHGFLPDVAGRLAEADVLLHLCPEEPFGLVVLEAFHAGLVVIGPDAGGLAQLIDDGVSGLHFRANDSTDLARVLRCLRAMSGVQLQRMADAGRQSLNERFSQAEGVRRYRGALDSARALERDRPPGAV